MVQQVVHKPTSKTSRILILLKDKRRVTQQELTRVALRYGSIIHELKKEGHLIDAICIDRTRGQWEYVYHAPVKSKNNRDGMSYESMEDEPKKSRWLLRRTK